MNENVSAACASQLASARAIRSSRAFSWLLLWTTNTSLMVPGSKPISWNLDISWRNSRACKTGTRILKRHSCTTTITACACVCACACVRTQQTGLVHSSKNSTILQITAVQSFSYGMLLRARKICFGLTCTFVCIIVTVFPTKVTDYHCVPLKSSEPHFQFQWPGYGSRATLWTVML